MLFEDIPDSGQEYPANGDDGFLVSPAALDAAIPFAEFRMLFRLHESIGHLDKKRFQVSAGTRNTRAFHLAAALVVPLFLGQQPAHEQRFFAEGKTVMSLPISDSTMTAVIGL